MRLTAGLVLAALTACAPLPDSGGRELTAEGVRPGVGSAAAETAAPPVGSTFRYLVATPLRGEASEMTVTFRRDGSGRYLREETVRLHEDTTAEAGVIATMVRQREGREAEVVGTDVILRATDEIDRRGRTLVSDRGGGPITYAPHDCRATLGECRIVRTGPDGRPAYLLARTSEAGGIWREEVRRDPARDPQGRTSLMEEAFYSLDANGVLLDMNRIDHERELGGYQEIRRVE